MKTKTDYIDSLALELKEWSAQIELLKIKAESAAMDLKLKYRAEIAALNVKQITAAEKIRELEAASGDAWDIVKETAEHVWHDLRVGMSSLVSKFQ